MSVTEVSSTKCDPPLIARLRGTLDGADELLLCIAFVTEPGVQLLRRQIKDRQRVRLLATTSFGTTTAAALSAATDLGAEVRVLNPSAGTYHPKLYLARHGSSRSAVVGSANLTGGLVANVEVCTFITDLALSAWEIGERLWADPRSMPWVPEPSLDIEWDEILVRLSSVIPVGSEIRTLGRAPRLNRVDRIDAAGVWIETERSSERGTGPRLVNAWMLRLAWDYLMFHGRLSNRYLLADDGLNVKRSSAVCALLAQLPEVEVVLSSPIELAARSA